MAKPVLLTLAGRKRTTGVGGAWDGGVVVQLSTDGTWSELAAGDTVAWNLQNFECSGVHVMFHIRSAGFGVLNTPDRGQLYRSIDKGVTWTDVTPQDGVDTEYVVDVSKDADDNFWCITDERDRCDDVNPNVGPSRIYKSTDYGVTWTKSLEITDQDLSRYRPAFNITCHPTDSNIIIVEGTEMVGWNSRLWRTTDGGSNWSAAITPTFPTELAQVQNVSGSKEHVFNYTLGGDLVYAGIFEIANDDLFVLKSLDNGDTFGLYYTEATNLTAYGAVFQEATLVYLLHQNDLLESAAPVGPGQITQIADNADSPFTTDYNFHGLSRHEVGGTDTLHIGTSMVSPGSGATDDPSVWTRPADLSSGWIQHTTWDNMESDLGYRVYVAINGVVGATELEPEVVRPPRPVSPPVGPSGGESAIGVAEPGLGIAEPPTGIREKQRSQEAPMRLRRRQEILPPEEQVLPPRAPPFLMGDRIDKHQPLGLMSPGPKVDKWLSFGWLTPAVLAGQKTLSLRDWGPVEAQSWQRAQLAFAYDEEPSKGGSKMALLRISHTPYKRLTNKLRNSDFYASGLMYAQSMGLRHPQGLTPEQVWSKIKGNSVEIWIVRYRVEQIYDQLAPTRDQIRVGY